MKRLGTWVVLLVLLSGCSGEDPQLRQGMELRSRLLKAAGCNFDAEITADYGKEIYCFSMSCQADGKGDVQFIVTQPESIGGITGTIREDGGELTFDETALFFEQLADDQISPVSAPWVFLRTLRSGYLTSAGREDGLLRLTIDDSYEDDALTMDIWVEAGTPVRAEICYDGKRIVSMNIKNFEIV